MRRQNIYKSTLNTKTVLYFFRHCLTSSLNYLTESRHHGQRVEDEPDAAEYVEHFAPPIVAPVAKADDRRQQVKIVRHEERYGGRPVPRVELSRAACLPQINL